MSTHHIRTSNMCVQDVKLYGIVILSISRQLAETFRGLLQPHVYQTNIYQFLSFQSDKSPCASPCVYGDWFCVYVYTELSYATSSPSFTMFPIYLCHHALCSQHLCMQEGTINKKKQNTVPFPKQWRNTSVKSVSTVILSVASHSSPCWVTWLARAVIKTSQEEHVTTPDAG